jgi:predicted Zn-dependent protease
VKEAERILDDGNPREALGRVRALLAGKRSGGPPKARPCARVQQSDSDFFEEEKPTTKGLTRRAHRILALANLRLDACTGAERGEFIEDAVRTLQYFVEQAPNDAAKETDLGEALARTGAPNAKRILEDLAKRDVLATPYAYAALARLRARSGDKTGSEVALARCKTMAKVASICAGG